MDTFLKENLITTKNAAELSGYTSDYLARLARSGKIVGKKIGHSWLVDTESLARFSEEQGGRKIDYARELARTREAEYLLHQDSRRGVAHHSSPNQGTNIPVQTCYISQLDIAKSPLRSNIFAFSIATLVLISAALVAQAGVIQRLAEGTGSLAFGIASGFNGVSDDISSYVASRAGTLGDEIRAQFANAAAYRSLLPARTVSPLEEFNLSVVSQSNPSPARPLSFFENTPPRSFATLAFIPAAPTPAHRLETLRASASATYAFLTTPSRIIRTLEDTFIASGAAIIDAAHFAIRADVAFAYNFGNAAPEGARAVTALLGNTGDLLARATARVPTLATALYLRATDAPATLAPSIASAVFDAEYRVAARYVALANTVAARYVALISGTGNLAYEGTAGTLTLARAAASLLSRAPAALEDAYLETLGKGALALRSLEGELKDEIELAAVLPALSAGERVALFTYQTVRGLFDSATRALAALFGTSSNIAIVSSPSPTVLPFATSTTSVNAPRPTIPPSVPVLPASAPAPRIAVTNYPIYTTVVKGVSEDFMNQSLASLRTGILATVAGMVQPVAAQTVTNATTIQQVNMIQDLSNLIVRNGDFRGGTFDNGIRVSATDGNFTNLTGGATSGTSGTFSGGLTAATLGVGTTSPSDTFAVAGPLYLSQISAPGVTTNRLYNVAGALTWNGTALGAGGGGTSSWATTTSQVAGRLVNYSLNTTDIVAIGNNSTTTASYWFDPNTTTAYLAGNVGIGTTSPYAKLSVVGETVSSYFTATSTTATSTFSGGMSVGGNNGLNVLSNGRTMIGTNTIPGGAAVLTIRNTAGLSDTLQIDSNTANYQMTLSDSYTDATSKDTAILMAHYSNSSEESIPLISGRAQSSSNILFIGGNDITTGEYNAATELRFLTGATNTTLNGTTRMLIDSSGNVGIGTTSPYAKLSVVGETVSSYITATSTTATSTFAGPLSVSSRLYVRGGIATGDPYNASDPDITIGGAWDDTGVNYRLDIGGGGWLTTDPTSISFFTSPSYTTTADQGVERMTIISNGNVGIGDVTPSQLLDVDGTNPQGLFEESTTEFLRVGVGETSGTSVIGWDDSDSLRLGVYSNPTDVTISDLMTILSTGNVGIGTTSPYAKLSVVGEVVAANFTATSTTATSTFSGGLLGANNFTVQQSSGRVGIGTTTPRGSLDVQGAGYFKPQTNAFNTTSAYTALVLDSGTGGALYAIGRNNPALEPYVALSGYDSGTVRGLYYGGGGWNVPDANSHEFYTAPTYTETNDTGVLRLTIDSTEIVATIPFAAPIGSASAPGYRFVNNNNTGLFAGAAAGFIGFSTYGTEKMRIISSGNVGIGTTSPYAKLSVVGETVASYFTATSTTATSTFKGAVGIGTSTPWRTLSVTGTVAFSGITSAIGAGSLCLTSANDVTYNSGSDACLSSLRSTKHDIHNLTVSGLDTLDALQPVSFVYNTDIVPDGRTRYGFVAEDTAVVDRHLTSYDAKGALSGIDDRAILSVTVRAIQELHAKFSVPRDATTTMPSAVLTADGEGIDLYKLATHTLSGMEALAAKVDAQNMRLTSLEERVAALESGAVSSAGSSPVSFSTSSLASALDSFGVLIQKGIAQFNTLVFRQLVASSDADGTSSAGSVTILAGNTVAQVNNSLVSPSTKAFVTFNSPITGSWWVSDKAAGSFRVVLSAPQDADVSFDYFLVQTEGQIAASTTDGSFGGETATATVAVSPPSSTDTVPPVITLLGDNPMYLSIGGEFIEPGITVTDNVDSVVPYSTFVDGIQMETSSATIDTSIQTTHIITYSATDSGGNSATATRAVIVGGEASAPADSGSNDSLQAGSLTSSAPVVSDVEPPVVTLVGAAALQIDEGQTFTDPGATARDDIDGDLTANIVVTGTVDTTTADLYTLTYSATDAAGNSGSASRVVTVVEGQVAATSTSATIE